MIIKRVETEEELDRIAEFRYKIFVEEQGKKFSFADHKGRQLKDSLDNDAIILMGIHDKMIVGTLRFNVGCKDSIFDVDDIRFKKFQNDYSISKFNNWPVNSLAYTSRMAVIPSRRASNFTINLMIECYKIQKEMNILFNFLFCDSTHEELFGKIGFLKYKDEFTDFDLGIQVPLVGLIEDIDYLHDIKSPLPSAYPRNYNNSESVEWFKKNFKGFK